MKIDRSTGNFTVSIGMKSCTNQIGTASPTKKTTTTKKLVIQSVLDSKSTENKLWLEKKPSHSEVKQQI